MRRTTLGPLSAADLNNSMLDSSFSASGIGKLVAGKALGPGSAKKGTNYRLSITPGLTAQVDPR